MEEIKKRLEELKATHFTRDLNRSEVAWLLTKLETLLQAAEGRIMSTDPEQHLTPDELEDYYRKPEGE